MLPNRPWAKRSAMFENQISLPSMEWVVRRHRWRRQRRQLCRWRCYCYSSNEGSNFVEDMDAQHKQQ